MKTKHFLLTVAMFFSAAHAEAQGSAFDIPTLKTYGLHGNVKDVSSFRYHIKDGDTIQRDTLYALFNQDGQIAKSYYPNSGELPYNIYNYVDGKITEWTNYDDSSFSRYFYHYDADGCPTKVTHTYNEDGINILSDTSYIVCDEQCRITSDGYRYYTYNKDGLVETMSYDDNFIIYEYDSQRRLTKQIWKEGSSQNITEYIHDVYGNITDEIWTITRLGISSQRHISYILDHYGNWTTLKDGNSTIHRTINYYDD